MRPRPNPFTSWEGCFLSSTVWGISFILAFVGGAFVGSWLGGDQASLFGAVLAGGLVTFTPWRRWILAGLQRRKDGHDSRDDSRNL